MALSKCTCIQSLNLQCPENDDFLLFSGNYKVQLYDPRTNGFAPSSPNIGMHVEVRDPEDKIILSKVYSSEGKWTFTSHTPGEHVICLYTNSTKWFSGTQLVSILCLFNIYL